MICFLSALGVESRLLGVRPVYHDERVLTGRFAALVDLRASIYAGFAGSAQPMDSVSTREAAMML